MVTIQRPLMTAPAMRPSFLQQINPKPCLPKFKGEGKSTEEKAPFDYDSLPYTEVIPELEGWEMLKETIQAGMSRVVRLMPQSFLQKLESTNLFAGHYLPNLDVTLADLKKKMPKNMDMLKQIEEVRFRSSDTVENNGWYIQAKGDKPTILHSMGNKSSLASILRFAPLVKEGYGVFAYEYPGYGNTQGTPTEESLSDSVEAASEFLKKEKGVPRSRQVGYGISLGGAATATLAHRYALKGVILESTMTSFPEVTKCKVENYAPSWVLPLHEHTFSQMKSVEKMPVIEEPLLVLHGSNDTLMPVEQAQRLFDAAPSKDKKLVILEGQPHNIESYLTIPFIHDFLEGLSQPTEWCSTPTTTTENKQRQSSTDTLAVLHPASTLRRKISGPGAEPDTPRLFAQA